MTFAIIRPTKGNSNNLQTLPITQALLNDNILTLKFFQTLVITVQSIKRTLPSVPAENSMRIANDQRRF